MFAARNLTLFFYLLASSQINVIVGYYSADSAYASFYAAYTPGEDFSCLDVSSTDSKHETACVYYCQQMVDETAVPPTGKFGPCRGKKDQALLDCMFDYYQTYQCFYTAGQHSSTTTTSSPIETLTPSPSSLPSSSSSTEISTTSTLSTTTTATVESSSSESNLLTTSPESTGSTTLPTTSSTFLSTTSESPANNSAVVIGAAAAGGLLAAAGATALLYRRFAGVNVEELDFGDRLEQEVDVEERRTVLAVDPSLLNRSS